ncbi:unnamed protein product [Cochlearia groenlandica]
MVSPQLVNENNFRELLQQESGIAQQIMSMSIYLSKDVLTTNQYSVTEYYTPMNDFDRTWPAVYFLYDLSPITVTIKEERRSFLHLITRLCAVLGGTFALTGFVPISVKYSLVDISESLLSE